MKIRLEKLIEFQNFKFMLFCRAYFCIDHNRQILSNK